MEIKYIFNEKGPYLKEVVQNFITLYELEEKDEK